MNSFETKFLNESYSCHSRDHDKGAWLRTAMSFLGKTLSSQKGNYEKASELLARSNWSKAGLNALAYASFCFWHRPLAVPKRLFAHNPYDADWAANKRTNDLVCREDLSRKDQIVWKKVNHRLALACIALKALSLREVLEKGNAWSFQAKLLMVLPQRLAKEPYFIEVNKKWKLCQALCRENKPNSLPPLSFKEAFSSIDLKEVSEEAAKIFCQTADEFFSEDFGGISSVKAYFPEEGKGGSGCYNYSDGEGYLVLPDTFWSCMKTLPAFLSFTAHEVLHMHQIRSVELDLLRSKEEKKVSASPFFAEFLISEQDLKVRDFPCQTFSVQGDHARNAIIPTLAYLYRPKEFLAYQFHNALQMVLAKEFETPFVKPNLDAGFVEFARAAGVKVEPDQPERSKTLLSRTVPSPSRCLR